jgi:transposase-like protein
MKQYPCPCCKNREKVIKKGTHIRKSDRKIIQRFFCKSCNKNFSEQTLRFDYRLQKRHINKSCFKLLCKGLSERACALVLSVVPRTISRRLVRLGFCARKKLAKSREEITPITDLVFDEMESFEHTKCKPLTMAIAVEMQSRKILSVNVGKIRAKGHLAEIAKKKYGARSCERKKTLRKMFSELQACCNKLTQFISDKSWHYPALIQEFFAGATTLSYKGRRGCVVGQGELKATGWDPLFSLNHSAAMFRDNVKRLSRKTWCTTKKIVNLEHLMHIYACFHNMVIDNEEISLRGFLI